MTTETGSSYKLVKRRDINVMLAAMTQFSGLPIHYHQYRHHPASENGKFAFCLSRFLDDGL